MTALSLIGPRPAALGGRDPVEDARDREADVVHAAEGLVVERVEADGDAVQAGLGEVAGARRQQRPVGGQRQVVDAIERRQSRDQPLEPLPHQWLAAGEPDLAHAQRDRDAHDALDLVEVEDLGARQEGVVRPERLARHAVAAAEVAPIGDADAQVAHRSLHRVEDGHRARPWVEDRTSADQLAKTDGQAEPDGDRPAAQQCHP